MSENLLCGVRVKIDRAKYHLVNLESAIHRYHSSTPYEIVAEADANSGNNVFRFRYLQPIPKEWGGIIGEIIHALRSALDNLATALVIHNGATSKTALKETYFPIGASKEAFQDSMARRFSRTSPAAQRIVERLKPYKGGTTAFWQLHQLDILDKHTGLIPVGTGTGKVGIQFPTLQFPGMKGTPPTLPLVYFDLNRRFPLKDGDEVFQMGLTAAAFMESPSATAADFTEEARKNHPDLQFTFHVSFGEGQIIDGEPVIPALAQFIDFAERVVDIFARNVLKCEW